jgi:antirestriction protein ArdC
MKYVDSIPVYSQSYLRELGIESGLGKLNNNTKTPYDIITERIVALIESSDELVWRKTWETKESGDPLLPMNFKSKENYRGANLFWLGMFMKANNLRNPYFLTFNQITELKGSLRKGSKSIPVVFYTKNLYRNTTNGRTITAEKFKTLSNAEASNYEPSFTMQYYNVFSAIDIDGIEFPNFAPYVKPEKLQIESCEEILKNAPNMPPVGYGGDQAYYQYPTDIIQMPKLESFGKEQEFYSTLYHEMVHATGSPNRLDREEKKKRKAWGDSFYAYEELIAELGASYLCGQAGILYFTLDNSAAYLKSWKKGVVNELKNDPKFFFRAAADAQKGADYILNLLPKEIYEKYQKVTIEGKPRLKTDIDQSENKAFIMSKAKAKLKLLALKF